MEELILSDELFIGKGGQRRTYIHPKDPSKCVKILYASKDTDIKKELRYRKLCADKLEKSLLITKFFGTAQTNFGLGYVYERVRDFDGNTSKDLGVYLKKASADTSFVEKVQDILLKFKEDFLRECIVVVDRNTANFMVQEISQGIYQVRIVDNIGTPVLIPLVYYFDFAARWKAQRMWNIWVSDMEKKYPSVVTPEFAETLRAKAEG